MTGAVAKDMARAMTATSGQFSQLPHFRKRSQGRFFLALTGRNGLVGRGAELVHKMGTLIEWPGIRAPLLPW